MRTAPLRYELLVNGRKIAVAGIDGHGVLSGIVSWVNRNPQNITADMRAREGFDEARFLQEICEVTITGLDSSTNRHMQWVQHALQPGDEVTFRILPEGECDEPK